MYVRLALLVNSLVIPVRVLLLAQAKLACFTTPTNTPARVHSCMSHWRSQVQRPEKQTWHRLPFFLGRLNALKPVNCGLLLAEDCGSKSQVVALSSPTDMKRADFTDQYWVIYCKAALHASFLTFASTNKGSQMPAEWPMVIRLWLRSTLTVTDGVAEQN